ncbi:hypothetical protein M413DRAFT_32208 [Hebeloma cylindrosporum]|uniref:Fido domain-containing protein n=1 Tax=Hebeloma cylindrosporum TaxID=76867 RepID=A0A0C3BWT7_HEBCY|nr:hypothetical protein M413DRAFT_32208 [Hebeloma cylindrosporum h7]
MSRNDVVDTIGRVQDGIEPDSEIPDLNKKWTQCEFDISKPKFSPTLQHEADFLKPFEWESLAFPGLGVMNDLYQNLARIQRNRVFSASDFASASYLLLDMSQNYSRLPSDPRSYFLFYQALTSLYDFPLALSVLDELISLMRIPSPFIAKKRQALIDYLAKSQIVSEESAWHLNLTFIETQLPTIADISRQNSLPDSAFQHRYKRDLPLFPTPTAQIRHTELIPFLQSLSPTEPDLPALEKLAHYTAIETNRIAGHLSQLGQHDTYTKIILQHGITPDVIIHADNSIPNPHYISLVLSDTAAAADACGELVHQQSAITREWLFSVHARHLQYSRVSLSLDTQDRPVLAAISTGRFKSIPNSPVIRPASRHVPPLIHQYCPPSLVEDHMTKFIAQAEIYLKDPALDPYLVAAWLHYAFVAIHPFQDGNGRMSRLLASIALRRHHLFPLLVTIRDKRRYQDVLLAANGGDLLPLSQFIVDMQVQSSLVVLSKPGPFRPLHPDYLTKLSSIAAHLTVSLASHEVQTEVTPFDGTSVLMQETSWVVRKDGCKAIRLNFKSDIVGQILITTVDPLNLGIVVADFRDEIGSSRALEVIRNLRRTRSFDDSGELEDSELAEFVDEVVYHIKRRDFLRPPLESDEE